MVAELRCGWSWGLLIRHSLSVALVCLAAGSPSAQTEARRSFLNALAGAKAAYAEISGLVDRRAADRKFAFAALRELDRAKALAESLTGEQRAFAHFGAGVWRAMVHWRLGRDSDKSKATEIGLQVREAAFSAGCYRKFYRALLLIVLWRSMGDEFSALLDPDDEFGDGAYLRADPPAVGALADLQGKTGWQEMVWLLELLKADIELTVSPARAGSRLRKLAMKLADENAGSDLLAECHSRLAWHFIEMRDFDRAEIFLDELPREKTRYPRAMIAYKQEEFEDGAEEARALCKQRGQASDYLLLGNFLERQACIALDAGERHRLYNEAKQVYFETLRVYRSTPAVAQDPTVPGGVYNGLGDCHLGLDELELAERAFEKALAALADQSSWVARAEIGDVWKDQGRLAERRGDSKLALRKFLDALGRVEDVRRQLPLDRLGIAWLEKSLLEPVDGVLRLACAGQATPLQALVAVDSMQARGTLDWMTGPPSRQDLKQFRDAMHELSTAVSASAMQASQRKLERLRAGVVGQRQARPLTETGLRSLLAANPDTTFLSYWVGKNLEDRRIYGLVARGAEFSVHDLGTEIEGLARYRAALAAVSRPAGDAWAALDAASGFFLPASLCAAVESRGAIVLSVDAEIGSLPFEALRVDGQPLGVSRVVYRAPSLAVFARLEQRPVRAGRVLILHSAAPPAAEQRLHGLSQLRYSRAEADAVAKWHGGAVELQAADATLANLRAQLGSGDEVGLLHFSCHAITHSGIPSASLLMLTDGPLDMATLATLPLHGLLVVFSSCRSKGSQNVHGEGVKGLLWGSLSAGARTVVASHWEMNQQATKDLMSHFHYHLAKGASEGEAMRRARATLAAAPNYAHPSYWAGFGVYGVPRVGGGSSLSFHWTSVWLAGAAVVGLLFLGLYWRARRRRQSDRATSDRATSGPPR